jgi:hypothetical protein
MTRTRVIGAATVAGLAVLTVWLFMTSLNATGVATIVGYQHTGDPRKIVVIVALGQLDDIAERQVQEDATTVRVTVRKRSSAGTAPANLIFLPVTVALRDPLRDRTVLDAKGVPVRDRGTYELPDRPTAPP